MANEFNVEKTIETTAQMLKDAGMPADEAQRAAEEQVNSMGATKTLTGKCPLGKTSPMACMFCQCGHMTECHYPHTCEEAECSHYKAEMEAEREA
jgi:hypothetical protein